MENPFFIDIAWFINALFRAKDCKRMLPDLLVVKMSYRMTSLSLKTKKSRRSWVTLAHSTLLILILPSNAPSKVRYEKLADIVFGY